MVSEFEIIPTQRFSLNEKQQECVESYSGALMMLAGAGAGKTKTLIAKIVFLLEQINVSPYEILALTFSNKAAREMRTRLAEYIPALDNRNYKITPMLSTFHSFCAFLLRQECEHIGLSKNFSIYDEADSESIVKSLMQRKGVTPKQLNPKVILNFIDRCKNRGLGINVSSTMLNKEPLVERFLSDSFLSRDPLYSYFLEYQQELLRANALDFGGLINAVIELFLNYPDSVLLKYQKRFQYILVDEYQDTNKAQFLLLYLLSKNSKHLCVVGDEDQSIYSWRGADISNILDFEKYFFDYKLIKLEQNYRSSANIINAASKVIENNVQRKGKKMWTNNGPGELIDIFSFRDDYEEAVKVVDIIENNYAKGMSFDEMAVLFRSSACSRLLEDELRKKRIPYRIVGGIKFYDRKEVKDLLAYLRILINPADNVSLVRIINVPVRGIGTTSLKKLEEAALLEGISLFTLLDKISSKIFPFKVSSKALQGITSFIQIFNAVREKLSYASVTEIFQEILKESGLKQEILSSEDSEAQDRWNNIEQLYNAIAIYEQQQDGMGLKATIEGFLESITLDHNAEEDQRGVVSLMTIHAAKGLEFPLVCIVSVEEGSFPSYQSLERGESALEEERRLFYVAMTRAKSKLCISYARGRLLWGQVRHYDPSQFLAEVPLEFVSWKTPKIEQRRYVDYAANEGKIIHNNAENNLVKATFVKGSYVSHDVYGLGQVMGSEGSGDDEKVMIKFQQGSLKKFIIKFANIKKVD